MFKISQNIYTNTENLFIKEDLLYSKENKLLVIQLTILNDQHTRILENFKQNVAFIVFPRTIQLERNEEAADILF
jgi:hypothetical protein